MFMHQEEQPYSRKKHGKQGGLLGWWLRLTAPPDAANYDIASTHQERERLRRAGLTSIVAPFVFFAPLLLLQQAVGDLGTAIGIGVLMLLSCIALVLNRMGMQILAALLLILSMDAVIEITLLSAEGGLSTGWLNTFDLLALPLMAVGILLSRHFLWPFLLLHIAFILGDFYFLPHAPNLEALIVEWKGPFVVFGRPILIEIGVCLLSYVQIRSTDRAIARANRAEEFAQLQLAVAEEKRQLEHGIADIMETLANAANGRYTLRSTLGKDNKLWQISNALNLLFARLQNSRENEGALRHIEQVVGRLVQAIRLAKRGEFTTWPLPSGGRGPSSVLDPLVEELRSTSSPNTPQNQRPPKRQK